MGPDTAISTSRMQGLGDFERDWRYKDGDAFVQDDFKVAKRLTLNLGVRWEHIGDLGVANGGGNVDVSKINPNPPVGAVSTATSLIPITTAPLSRPE